MNTKQLSFLLVLAVCFFGACGGPKSLLAPENLEKEFPDSFTGFILMDPENSKVLESVNADHYFTPASNVKLLTFFAALKIIEEPLPVFQVYQRGWDSYILGTGYPGLFHPDIESEQNALVELQKIESDRIFFCDANLESPRYGPGWAWDDYTYGFQAERSALPLFGNTVNLIKTDPFSLHRIFPASFESAIDYDSDWPYRKQYENLFYFPPAMDTLSNERIRIPFITTDTVMAALLSDRIGRDIIPVSEIPSGGEWGQDIKTDVPLDDLLRIMMQESDNHIAEQLLLLCSYYLDGSLNAEKTIAYCQENLLTFLPDPPFWVDGSGLSRYNLLTPRSTATLLSKLFQEIETERLLSLFPAGGESGTIENWYNDDTPYVFAKTGTLRNHHCLSGYIICDSGRILVFSFMHDNYPGSSSSVKYPMEKILQAIQDKY